MAALASDLLTHFRLFLWNRWTEFNETWQEARSQRPLPSLCFSGRSEKQDGRPGLWLAETFLLFLWNRWMEFNETWQEARSQSPLPSLCFFNRSEKQDGRPGLWLAETFLIFLLKPLNGIQRNLTGSNISMPSTKFVFCGPIGKTRWPPWPLIGRDIFDFSSETAERNSTKLDRKQDLNALYQVCVFQADQKNKMAALASDWLRHFLSFPLKLDRKQDLKALYQGCVFRADRKNKMAAPTSDWLRHFLLLCRNSWTEFNETWQEARSQRPLPSLSFSGWSEKQDGRLASDWLRHFLLLLWNRWMEFNETWQEARSKRPLPSLCFSGRSEKQDGLPGLWLAETFLTSPLKPNRIQRNLIGSKISMPSTKFVFFRPIGKTKWPPWPLIGWDILTSLKKPLNGIQGNLTGSKLSMPSTTFVFSGQSGKSAHGTAHAWRCLARSTQGRIQGRAKIGDGGGGRASSRKCFFRLEGYTNKPNV